MCILYETLWNFVSTAVKNDYGDYTTIVKFGTNFKVYVKVRRSFFPNLVKLIYNANSSLKCTINVKYGTYFCSLIVPVCINKKYPKYLADFCEEYICNKYLLTSIYISKLLPNFTNVTTIVVSRYSVKEIPKCSPYNTYMYIQKMFQLRWNTFLSHYI